MLTHDNLFSDNRIPSNDEAHVLHAVSCSPFLARMLGKDALLLQDLLENLYISYKIEDMQKFLSTQNIFDESSLKIFRWDGNNWIALDDCIIDPILNNISCESLNFSVFGLFGQDAYPVISNVSNTNITRSAATILWNTNEPATSKIIYGKTITYGSTTAEYNQAPMVTSHSMFIDGLQGCTTYHYRIISRDSYGNVAMSEDHTLKTSGCSFNHIVALPITGSDQSASDLDFPSPTPIPQNEIKELSPVQIYVVDSTGKPVVNAKVNLFTVSQGAYTNAQGVAEFANIPTGQYRITVEFNNVKIETDIEVKSLSKKNEFKITLPLADENELGTWIFMILLIILTLSLWFFQKRKRKNIKSKRDLTNINFISVIAL